MATAEQRPDLIDLTQDNSDDGMNVDEAVPSHQSTITNEGTDEQDPVSEDEDINDNQPSFDRGVRAPIPPTAASSFLATCPSKAVFSMPSEISEAEEAQSLHAAGGLREQLDANHNIKPKDIRHLGLRRLVKLMDDIIAGTQPYVTVQVCRDMVLRIVGLEGQDAFNTLIGLLNDDSCSFIETPCGSSSTSPFVASQHKHQETSDNDSDVPWEVFHSFLTTRRADFNSGKEFLQACEKLRRKVLTTWNLQLTQKFTHTLFINAMHSYNPFLADVLRREQLAGKLEFHDLKRIIRMEEIPDDTIIGRRTWGRWKLELASPSKAGECEDADI
ncbi:hypothetical protein F4679DRAFT_588049 [Xylaria curta]|nr:hypothetical protein F4679DRAFT_588049 [Xylaria curta]